MLIWNIFRYAPSKIFLIFSNFLLVFSMELGSQLKKAREDRKLSQQEVAHLLDVSQKTLSNFESGKTVPNILQIAKLGVIYGLDMIKLLEKSGIFLAPLSSPLSKSNPITQPRDWIKKQKNNPASDQSGVCRI